MRAGFVAQRGLEVLRKHVRSALASVAAIGIAALLTSVGIMAWQGLERLYSRMQEQFAVLAFLSHDLSELELEQTKRIVQGWAGVQDVRYLSSKDALNKFLREFPQEAEMLKELGENPLPAVLEVFPKAGLSREHIDELERRLKAFPWVEEVDTGLYWVERVQLLLLVFEVVGLLLGLSMGISVVLIVMNTVRSFISSFRREQEILTFLGATPAEAVAPFVLAGTLLGALGAIAGAVAAFVGALSLSGRLPITEFQAASAAIVAAMAVLVLSVLGSLAAAVGTEHS